MKTILLLAVLVGFTCSPVAAQKIGSYEMWASWDIFDKACFLGGALSQLPIICDLLATHYMPEADLDYTSKYYKCMIAKHSVAMKTLAVRDEMDRLYTDPAFRKLHIGAVYRQAIENLTNKKTSK